MIASSIAACSPMISSQPPLREALPVVAADPGGCGPAARGTCPPAPGCPPPSRRSGARLPTSPTRGTFSSLACSPSSSFRHSSAFRAQVVASPHPRRALGRSHFQDLLDLEHLADVLRLDGRDRRAAPLHVLHQAVALELAQRLPHGRLADGKIARGNRPR
ncbi:MAG: hypothetical protein MZV63_60220 [Marinilabiliales bacterium]|nr:hypothetical protein [Marinilabiliales bacterium]